MKSVPLRKSMLTRVRSKIGKKNLLLLETNTKEGFCKHWLAHLMNPPYEPKIIANNTGPGVSLACDRIGFEIFPHLNQFSKDVY